MTAPSGFEFPIPALVELCRRYRVRELAVFGSVLGADFRPDSDIDFLVEFEPGAQVGFLTLAGLAREFSTLLGRKVDVVPKRGLKPPIRKGVLAAARILYAA